MGGNASALFDIEEVHALKYFSSSKRVSNQDAYIWELLFSTSLGLRRWLAATPALAQVKISKYSPHLRSNNVNTFNFQRLVRKTLKHLQLLPIDLGTNIKSGIGHQSSIRTNTQDNTLDSNNISNNNNIEEVQVKENNYSTILVQNLCNSLFLIRKFSQYFIEMCDGVEEELAVHFTEKEEIENIKRDMKPKKNKPRLVRDLLLGLMDFIVINTPNNVTYDLHVEIMNLLLVLLSTQMYHPLEVDSIDLDDSIDFDASVGIDTKEDDDHKKGANGYCKDNTPHIFLHAIMEIAQSDGLIGKELKMEIINNKSTAELVDVDLDESLHDLNERKRAKGEEEHVRRSSIAKKTMLASAFTLALMQRIVDRQRPHPSSAIVSAITTRNTLANEYSSMTSNQELKTKRRQDNTANSKNNDDVNDDNTYKLEQVRVNMATKASMVIENDQLKPPPSLLRLATDMIVRIPMRIYEYFFPSAAETCPLSERSMLLLCMLVNNHRNKSVTDGDKNEKDYRTSNSDSLVNPFLESFINIGDDHKTANGMIYSNQDEVEKDIYIPRISFEYLYRSLGPSLIGGRGAIFLYTLISGNTYFKDFLLARDDLDTIVLPLLETMYHADKVAPSHLYVLLILLLILSEDVSFNEGIHKRIIVQRVPWFKEYHLHGIPLGSLMLIMVLRTLKYNHTNKHMLMDAFVHENCYAILSNMSMHIRNIHGYSAQRLMSLLDVMNKRYKSLINRRQECEKEKNLILLLLDVAYTCIQPNMLSHNLELMYSLLHRKQIIEGLLINCNMNGKIDSSMENNMKNAPNSSTINMVNVHDGIGDGNEDISENNNYDGIRILCNKIKPIIRFFDEFVKNEMEKVTATINDDTTMSKFAENGMPQPYEATGINNTNESWTSEHVMQILELGQRQWYKTNEHQPDNSVRMNITRNYDKYIYEEVENPESFFLPYIWSMTYDSTPDIWWDANRILLFPMVLKS